MGATATVHDGEGASRRDLWAQIPQRLAGVGPGPWARPAAVCCWQASPRDV